jgi:hypothetical protein
MTAPTPITWSLAQEADAVGAELLPFQPTITVDVERYPDVAAIHGIAAGQQLRVIMRLPAGPMTYDLDAVVLDAGNGLPPIILWASQITIASSETCNDYGGIAANPSLGLCTKCWQHRCRK